MNRKSLNLPIHIAFFIMLLYSTVLYRYIFVNPYDKGIITQGVIDLSSINNASDLLVSLDGNWKITKGADSGRTVSVPEVFSSYNKGNNIYSAYIYLPEGDRFYSLIVPRINSEYTISINDKIIYDSVAEHGPRSIEHLQRIVFYAESKAVTLSIHPYNHYDYITEPLPILLGSLEKAENYYYKAIAVDFFFAVIVFCSGIFFFIQSTKEKKSHVYFSFSIICLVCLIRLLCMNSALIGIIFPYAERNLVLYLARILPPIIVISILIYSKEQFPDVAPVKLSRFITIGAFVYMILNLLLPKKISEYLIFIYAILLILSMGTIIYISYVLIRRRDLSACSYTMSSLVLFVSTAFDSIRKLNNIYYGYALTSGFIFFIIIQIIMLLGKNRVTYDEELKLSDSYQISLKNLEHEEANFLSAHLKAHFLFNALNIISGYALFEAETAKKITRALTTYLTQIFEQETINEMGTLKNEIDLVRAFGYIESERFPNIDFIYDIPKEIPDITMPSLFLQPLLENAVNHGIRKKAAGSKGRIIVSVHLTKYHVQFCIKDDGVGFPEEAIKKALQEPSDGSYHSLYHLQYQLKRLYNESLVIRSAPNVGTIVTFKIPS